MAYIWEEFPAFFTRAQPYIWQMTDATCERRLCGESSRSSLSDRLYATDAFDGIGRWRMHLLVEVAGKLRIQPGLCARAQGCLQTHCRVGRDSSLPLDYFIDTLDRNSDTHREL